MSNKKKSQIFKDLYFGRNRMFNSYRDLINVQSQEKLDDVVATVVFEFTGTRPNLSKKEDLSLAIKNIMHFRNKHARLLKVMELDCIDFRREHNLLASSITGIRTISAIRSGMTDDNSISDMIEYEDDESNPSRSPIVSLRIAEIELTKRLYDLSDARYKSEGICKVAKYLIRDLNARMSRLS